MDCIGNGFQPAHPLADVEIRLLHLQDGRPADSARLLNRTPVRPNFLPIAPLDKFGTSNADPKVLKGWAVTLLEHTGLHEHIAALGNGAEDVISAATA